MFSLRQTWNDVFPASKLYTLDVKVNCMDPGWPITAKVAPVAIHVNPNFFKNKVSISKLQHYRKGFGLIAKPFLYVLAGK